jgi:hypothetical protein
VVTATGSVLDVWAKRALHTGAGELLAATDERVVSAAARGTEEVREGVVAFDLRTQKEQQLSGAAAAPYELPGKRSPDGLKSVRTAGGELVLHRAGRPPQSLGHFHVHPARHSGGIGLPPVVWLDSDRFLTQDGNGNLIAVALDGTRTPVVTVPGQTDVVGAPFLVRNAVGQIIYHCSTDSFVIDVAARTWEQREWVALGHGFDASWVPDGHQRHAIRYRGEEVGLIHSWPNQFGYAVATDGYLALLYFRGPGLGAGCQVWCAATGKWTALDERAGLVIGWMR